MGYFSRSTKKEPLKSRLYDYEIPCLEYTKIIYPFKLVGTCWLNLSYEKQWTP